MNFKQKMLCIGDQLELLFPSLKQAITELNSQEDYLNWATQFINKIVEICLPGNIITLQKFTNP